MRGEQYLWLENNQVYDQRGFTRSASHARSERHRVRQVRNKIKPIVDAKISEALSTVPGYEVVNTTLDPEDVTAASLAQKILLGGYEQWGVRRAFQEAVWYAFVMDEGFVMPYFDPNLGPFVDVPKTEMLKLQDPETGVVIEEEIETGSELVGYGDIRLRTFGGSQVFWEPGVSFDDSRWHIAEFAEAIDTIEKTPGYKGKRGELVPDARERGSQRSKSGTKLVRRTEYYERPSKQHPEGRHLTIANDRIIFPEEPFPLTDAEGTVVDEPPMVRLSYTVDPDSDRDEGIVRHMIDAQRTYNDVNAKLLEWKNLALIPQMIAPKGSVEKRPTDAPGDIIEYETMPGQEPPQWRNAPPVPQELFQLMERAQEDMFDISHGRDVAADQVRSASEAEALIGQKRTSWGSFLINLASAYSRVGRDCLVLAQRHYTEERVMRYRGRLGWERIEDFTGADIRGQTDVRVPVASIEPRTRASIEQKIMNYAQMGWISGEEAISAIEGGSGELLVNRFDDEVSRVHRIVMRIKENPESLFGQMRPAFPQEQFPDPETGEPATEVPSWMPRPFDNATVQKSVLENWFKSSDYEACSPEGKEIAHLYYSALLDIEAQAAARDAEMQAQQAEQLGRQNATRPANKPMPSLPGMENTNAIS